MKFITEITEIAKTINLGKMPVVYVEDIAACKTDYGWRLGQVKISAKFGFIVADLYIFRDTKKLVTCSYGTCLKSSFGWSDVAEMATTANLPTIAPYSKFVLVVGKKDADEHRTKKGVVMVIDTREPQLNTDEPIAIEEDMRGMLAALEEIGE